jgi:hypothetical protein
VVRRLWQPCGPSASTARCRFDEAPFRQKKYSDNFFS